MSAWGWFAVIGGAVCAVLNAVNGEWTTAMFAALCAALYVMWDWSARVAEDLQSALAANIRGRRRANLALDLAVTTIEQTAMDTPEDEALRHKVLDTIYRTRHGLPVDAGSATLGHALGVVVVLGGLLLLLAVAGAIEGGGL